MLNLLLLLLSCFSLATSKGNFGLGMGPTNNNNYGCAKVKPADIRLNLLNGTWYVQMYTGPTTGGQLQTKCDIFNITVSPDAMNATINYTFINTISDQMGVEVANVTYKVPGFYLYQVVVQGQLISMNTYVLVLNSQYYVHMACSANNLDADATFLIASKNRDVTTDAIKQLLAEATELGADTKNVMMVDQINCNTTNTDT